MNLASVDSEVIGKTSLANVPRKFYPTLLLVGKDKKPATFMDEDGTPTNAMPRSNTLAEDREALSNLIQNPTPKEGPEVSKTVQSITKSPYFKTAPNTPQPEPLSQSVQEPNLDPELVSQSVPEASSRPLSSRPPDVGSDLVASQTKSPSGTASVLSQPMKGGSLLRAIRNKTASLNAMLRLRKPRKKTRRA